MILNLTEPTLIDRYFFLYEALAGVIKKNPANSNYRVKDGLVQIVNKDTGLYHTVTMSGEPQTLKIGEGEP